ncbi:hypothetical protein CR970_01335 [Candidatus Saccharibacteria bacterium]|nr:MAG: hypothetical protein CR970_01335 [Candidatus Saccharibacteria bacterium]
MRVARRDASGLIRNQAGVALPMILSVIIAMTIISSALLLLITSNLDLVRRNNDSQRALNIAEAGVNYYLWHLSHDGVDFRDGQSWPVTPDPDLGYGPYEHDYVDDNSKVAGKYTLWIKPQSSGSTIMTVRSTGTTQNGDVSRTIEANIGAPSFSSYGLVSDSALWFGSTESANGPVHSNQGIRMDGPSSDNVTSANDTYIPPSNLGGDGYSSRPGVWCDSSVTSPVDCDTRPKNDWVFPSVNVDFNQVSSSLCELKKVAFAADPSTENQLTLPDPCSRTPTTRTASYLPQRSASGSYSQTRGYLIELNPDNTYNVYHINGEDDRYSPYTSALYGYFVEADIPIPADGGIFVEDNVWVRSNPTFQGRVTIGAGRLATSRSAQIVIADDVEYDSKDGSDVIGLIAEDSVTIAPYAPPASGSFHFQVHAAIISRSGSVNYPLRYRAQYNRCTRGWTDSDQTFTYYGSVATRLMWTWTWYLGSWSCGDARQNSSGHFITGVYNNSTQYDYNLLYAPPPHFPITSTYDILSWREVMTQP